MQSTVSSALCEWCSAAYVARRPGVRFCSKRCSGQFNNPKRPVSERFTEKYIVDANGCWRWTAARDRDGYGQFNVDGKIRGAHQVSWVLAGKAKPVAGWELDHTCRNRDCVNPLHLEAVPHQENVRRGATADVSNGMRKACKRGHPFPENLYVSPKGFSTCRECKNTTERSRYRRLRANR